MRSFLRGAVACAALLALAGCGGPAPNSGSSSPEVTGNNAIDAGLAFSSGSDRDEMAIQLAREASGIGDVAAVRHALEKIADAAKHDSTAASCALTLARLSKGDDAVAIAHTIGNPVTRDAALSGIAASRR